MTESKELGSLLRLPKNYQLKNHFHPPLRRTHNTHIITRTRRTSHNSTSQLLQLKCGIASAQTHRQLEISVYSK